MSKKDNRTSKVEFKHTKSDLNAAYRHICKTMDRTVNEMNQVTNKHAKAITIQSVIGLCNYFKLKLNIDFHNGDVCVFMHKAGESPIEAIKEFEIKEEEPMPKEDPKEEKTEPIKEPSSDTEEEDEEDPF